MFFRSSCFCLKDWANEWCRKPQYIVTRRCVVWFFVNYKLILFFETSAILRVWNVLQCIINLGHSRRATASVYVQRAGWWTQRCYRALCPAVLISGVLLLSETGGSDRRCTMSGWPLVALLLAALCSRTALGWRVTPGCRQTNEQGVVVHHDVGEAWTTSDCRQAMCHAIPGYVRSSISFNSCRHPPSFKCLMKKPWNMSAEYPECCPEYQCPDQCFSPSLATLV